MQTEHTIMLSHFMVIKGGDFLLRTDNCIVIVSNIKKFNLVLNR